MDSPDPGSPASSSDSPLPEDVPGYPHESQLFLSSSSRDAYPSGSSGKRRLQMSSGAGSSAKSRRREDQPSRRQAGSVNMYTQPEYGRPQRDELVDVQLVDKIKAGTLEITSFCHNAGLILRQNGEIRSMIRC